jgi:hypothetical protein
MIDEFFILKSSNLVYHYSNSQKAKDIDKAFKKLEFSLPLF